MHSPAVACAPCPLPPASPARALPSLPFHRVDNSGAAEILAGQDATTAQLVLHIPEVIAREGMQHDVIGVGAVWPDGQGTVVFVVARSWRSTVGAVPFSAGARGSLLARDCSCPHPAKNFTLRKRLAKSGPQLGQPQNLGRHSRAG